MKTKKIIFLLIILITFLLDSCVTSNTGSIEAIGTLSEQPDWITKMPLEDDYFYGIGLGDNLAEAKQRAIIDVGQQFSIQVKSVLLEQVKEKEDKIETIITKIDEQITSQVVYGAKFIDQYQDKDGIYWILVKAPLSCMLDITEGFLLSYKLDLKQSKDDMDLILNSIEKTVDEKIFTKIPWTPVVPDGSIKINGNIDDWASIPVYFKGKVGDAQAIGTDLDYIKAAMDSEKAYFLLVCADSKWDPEVQFEINFDYAEGQLDSDPTLHDGRTDIHTNITREYANFWKDSPESSQPYDPGVLKRLRGNIFEFSVPLNQYNGTWFNILYSNIWLGDNNLPKDMNEVKYEDTWINEGAIPRVFSGSYGILLNLVEAEHIIVESKIGYKIETKKIQIDGIGIDWGEVRPVYLSQIWKDGNESKLIKSIYVAKDNEFLYLRMDVINDKPAEDETVFAFHLQNGDSWSKGDLELGYRVWENNWKTQFNRYLGNDEWEFGFSTSSSFGASGQVIELKLPLSWIINKKGFKIRPYIHDDNIGDRDSLDEIQLFF